MPKTLVDETLPINTGKAYELKQGQLLRVYGQTTADFVAFNLHDLKERFDQARTKSNQSKIFISTGDVLFSQRNNVLLTVTDDQFPGHHDMQKGMCSRKRIEMVFLGKSRRDKWGGGQQVEERWEDLPSHGCWENLSRATEAWGIDPDDLPGPFNLFQNTRIDSDTGIMYWDLVDLDGDVYVEMRAETDCLVAVSNCPGGRGPLTRIVVSEP